MLIFKKLRMFFNDRTRDVSVVLDALLKTQSRAILMGIVNEDGKYYAKLYAHVIVRQCGFFSGSYESVLQFPFRVERRDLKIAQA